MRANEAIARILSREGVEYLFCFPAHGLIEACAAEGIRPIVARTERTLVNMADGYTRVHDARRFGVCAVQATAARQPELETAAARREDLTDTLHGRPPWK